MRDSMARISASCADTAADCASGSNGDDAGAAEGDDNGGCETCWLAVTLGGACWNACGLACASSAAMVSSCAS